MSDRKDEERRERYRRVPAASPLPPDVKRKLTKDVYYMLNRLLGVAATPPTHWSPLRIRMFEEILQDPAERAALWAELGRGRRELDAATDALDDDDGLLTS